MKFGEQLAALFVVLFVGEVTIWATLFEDNGVHEGHRIWSGCFH